MNDDSYLDYWGKARPGNDTDPQFHLLAYHSLDVAAVGCVLLKHLPALRNKLAELAGVARSDSFDQWVVFFLALHDIGKFSRSFQNLRPDLLLQLQGTESNSKYVERHDSLGYLLWKGFLRERFIDTGLLKVSGSKRRCETGDTVVDIWMSVVTGHHGKPPRVQGLLRDAFVDEDLPAVENYLSKIVSLFLGCSPAPLDTSVAQFKRASWWLAGFSVLCDWLGSNTGWFPYCAEHRELSDYWSVALEQATRAVAESGLMPAVAGSELSLEHLLRMEEGKKALSTPLQALVKKQPISESPQLVIMEDVTGAGKTEAALLLAHRMMREAGMSGMYIGLPTMATANGMYRRIASVFRSFFDQSHDPSLILAHSARDMDLLFRQSVFPEVEKVEQNYGDDTEPAAAWCNQWLADNTKKALLADIGVGTIDQALLCVLPSKYQSLRLIGLLGKVLIVDEVHACDAYMHKLLCDLLKFHAAGGGNAILLSATLPKRQRESLLRSFAEGMEKEPPCITKTGKTDYPLLSHYIGDLVVDEQKIASRDVVSRTVNVTFLSDFKAVEQRVAEAVAQNCCVCWIRNTVPDARETWNQLKIHSKDWKVDLFHARFSLIDRMDIENDVLDRFGPSSNSVDRKGRVLIATQVVEQSLDLDFDLMITDLAPIDLIIQRAGRMLRHTRDRSGNRISGKDQRGIPELVVYGPKYAGTPDENWVDSMLPGTAAIYPHHGQLWLTSRWLSQHGQFRMPEDARDMIEGVYGEEFQGDVPGGLLRKTLEAEGIASAKASEGSRNMLKLEAGYSDIGTNQWWDEAITPTRLGETTTIVYLARWEGGALKPFRDVPDFTWQNNSLRMRTYWISSEGDYSEIPEQCILVCKKKLPGKGKWGVLLPLVLNKSGEWIGVAKDEEGENRRFRYDTKTGLLTENDMGEKRTNATESD